MLVLISIFETILKLLYLLLLIEAISAIFLVIYKLKTYTKTKPRLIITISSFHNAIPTIPVSAVYRPKFGFIKRRLLFMFEMSDTQQVKMTIKAVDKRGNPTTLDSP